MKKITGITALIIICFFALAGKGAYAQAFNGVGFTYGVNRPYSGDYSSSSGFKITGSIALTGKFAFTPFLGYESLNGNGRQFFEQPGFPDMATGRVGKADIFNVGIDAKYFLSNMLFLKAGPLLFVAGGNEDIINAGIGGSGSVGISLPVDEHLHIELSTYTDVIDLGNSGGGLTPYAGLRGSLFFGFGKPVLR